MKKKLWIASLSATALASLLLVNGNQVKAATDSGDEHPTEQTSNGSDSNSSS